MTFRHLGGGGGGGIPSLNILCQDEVAGLQLIFLPLGQPH